ncbi:MAG: hypothetical protein M3N68_10900 [Actinomycetota bacterium]|nr:hypothetical protein [Actinomycetota bacterium]
MYTFAVTVLLGLALFKIVDVIEDLVPGLAKLHDAVTVVLAIAGAFALDYSLFEGFGVGLREGWMGTLFTGVILAGTTSVWRALFHWLGTSEGEEPEVRHQGNRVISRAA